MNKERKGRFNDVISSLEEAKGELEDILNEEQDSYDSLPDGLQMSSRGEKMQDYICLMEDCISKIDEVVVPDRHRVPSTRDRDSRGSWLISSARV